MKLKRRIVENEAKLDVLVNNLATRTIAPEIYKKCSQKYQKEIKEAKDMIGCFRKGLQLEL
mgnify:CR=1 FL=1